jgi:crotonobetainyl-CoA:carnitine CoA-transferase CaiB-like acyl-CoA transferase
VPPNSVSTRGYILPTEALLDDLRLRDRDFWKEVGHPELDRSFVYLGEAAIHSGSPWRISRRAPLIGGHNAEILCEKLETVRSGALRSGGKSCDLDRLSRGERMPRRA